MLLDYLMTGWIPQTAFIAAVTIVIIASMMFRASKASALMEDAQKDKDRAHEEIMWRAKQGAIEHQKTGMTP